MGLPKYDPNDPVQRALYLDYGYDRTSPLQRLLYMDLGNEGEPPTPAPRPVLARAPGTAVPDKPYFDVSVPIKKVARTLFPPIPPGGFGPVPDPRQPGSPDYAAAKEAEKANLVDQAHARAAIEQAQPGAAAAATRAATPTPPADPPEKKEGTGPQLTGEPPYRIPGSPGYDLSELTTRDPAGRLRSSEEAEKRGLRFETVGGPQRFMGRGSVPSRRALSDFAAGPYSEKVRALQGEGYAGDLKKPGTWTFSGGYAETGRPGPREGQGTLSGLEQATARRDWLEQRLRGEQLRELGDVEMEQRRAAAEQAIKAAGLDPYEMARIRAAGQYGGEAIKAQVEAASREAAFGRVAAIYQAALEEKDPQRANLMMQIAAGIANTILGQRVADPRLDMFSALLGMGALGAPVGAGAGAVK